MNRESLRDLQVLEAIAEDRRMTQRRLSSRLGMALGLTNLYLKRLVHKGCVKCVNVRANRLQYLLTPKGLAEKTRLTYEFMQYSLTLYRQAREHLRDTLQPIAGRSSLRVAIYGTGEAAELAYLSLREMDVEPAAILDGRSGTKFLGLPVFDVSSHPLAGYDFIVVATLERQDEMIAQLLRRRVPNGTIVSLRRTAGGAARPPRAKAR